MLLDSVFNSSSSNLRELQQANGPNGGMALKALLRKALCYFGDVHCVSSLKMVSRTRDNGKAEFSNRSVFRDLKICLCADESPTRREKKNR